MLTGNRESNFTPANDLERELFNYINDVREKNSKKPGSAQIEFKYMDGLTDKYPNQKIKNVEELMDICLESCNEKTPKLYYIADLFFWNAENMGQAMKIKDPERLLVAYSKLRLGLVDYTADFLFRMSNTPAKERVTILDRVVDSMKSVNCPDDQIFGVRKLIDEYGKGFEGK